MSKELGKRLRAARKRLHISQAGDRLAKDIASLSPADRAVIEKLVSALKAEDKVVPG